MMPAREGAAKRSLPNVQVRLLIDSPSLLVQQNGHRTLNAKTLVRLQYGLFHECQKDYIEKLVATYGKPCGCKSRSFRFGGAVEEQQTRQSGETQVRLSTSRRGNIDP